MTKIYICVDRKNKSFATQIHHTLKPHSHGVLIDVVDMTREDNQILSRLQEASLIIALVGPGSMQSPGYRQRVMLARKLKKRILPVIVEPFSSGTPGGLGKYLDATGSREKAAARLVQIVNRYSRVSLTVRTAPNAGFGLAILKKRRSLFLAGVIAPVLLIMLLLYSILMAGDTLPIEPTSVQKTAVSTTASEILKRKTLHYRTPVPKAFGEDEEIEIATAEVTEEAVIAEDEPEETATVVASASSSTLSADFNIDPLDGPAPLTITLENLSRGDIASYAWDFNGDGVVDSTDANPEPFTYYTAGLYGVKLTISDGAGNQDVFENFVYVYDGSEEEGSSNVYDPKQPDTQDRKGTVYANLKIRPNPDYGKAPLTVTFQYTSTVNIVSYAWDFNGDGITDSTSGGNPTYVYDKPGKYNPSLTVTTQDGHQYSDQGVVTVIGTPSGLLALFDVNPDIGEAPLKVNVTNYSEGNIVSYAWDFDGDGTTDNTSANPPPYTYNTPGDYEITLVVKDANGRTDSDVMYVTVDAPEAPTAILTAQPLSGKAPLTVTFTSQSLGKITEYAWDFNGDGVVDSTSANPPPYTYNVAGDYEASLVVAGPGGESDPEYIYISVESLPPPIASFSLNPASGKTPLVVTFTNQSSGSIAGYAWDFNGDGVVDSTSQNPPPYTYQTPGGYVVSLVVTGTGGTTATAMKNVTVDAVPPVAAVKATPLQGPAPLVVTFTNQSSGDITGYAWDFDGDSVVDSTAAAPPPYTYTKTGTYQASLVVSGPGGKSQPAKVTIEVTGPEATAEPLQASFSADVVAGVAPLVVTFTNQSSGDITGYAWDFNGDGVMDSTVAAPPPYTYPTAGTYQASLVVSGSGGGSDTATVTIEVTGPEATAEPLQASFSADVVAGVAPLVVTFTNQSSGDITGYAWDFNGDGVVDSTVAAPPPYTYPTAGTYQASLVVNGSGGGSDTATVTIEVTGPEATAEPLQASFSADVVAGVAPLVVTFTNQSSGDITGYAWDFNGDGVVDSTVAAPPPYTYPTAGTYQASLVVNGPGGTSQPFVQAITVQPAPPPPPSASFSADVVAGVAPLVVTFTNQSSGDITGYAWDFNGDGVVDSTAAAPPPYTYPTAGTYQVSLVVNGPGGTSQPFVQAITVQPAPPPPPSASFSADVVAGVAPLVVTFTNQSSGDITGYAWDFNGDGVVDSTSAAPPPYTYPTAGTYRVSLVVNGPGGTSQPFVQAITVQPAP